MAKTREGYVLEAVLGWLEHSGFEHWRVPLSPIVRGGGKTKVSFSANPMRGFPDIVVISRSRPGTLYGFELKAPAQKTMFKSLPAGRVEKHQKDWHKRLISAGCKVAVVYSLDEFVSKLREFEQSW